MAQDQSTLYKIGTPRDVPLRFNRDGYYRLAAKATCRRCGRSFVQVLRCHRFETELRIMTGRPAPNPSDEKIVTSMMVRVHNNGVGNPKVHMRGCSVAKMPKAKHLLAGVGKA